MKIGTEIKIIWLKNRRCPKYTEYSLRDLDFINENDGQSGIEIIMKTN